MQAIFLLNRVTHMIGKKFRTHVSEVIAICCSMTAGHGSSLLFLRNILLTGSADLNGISEMLL